MDSKAWILAVSLLLTVWLAPVGAAGTSCAVDACVAVSYAGGDTDPHYESDHWSKSSYAGDGTLTVSGNDITCSFNAGSDGCDQRGELLDPCDGANARTTTVDVALDEAVSAHPNCSSGDGGGGGGGSSDDPVEHKVGSSASPPGQALIPGPIAVV